jgi:phosphoribosyl-ATP pyrophosphohydrolase/phosphoribosyl-AMP cyclohydrolase
MYSLVVRNLETVDFSKGLAPAVVQDAETNQVLMLAYVNEESLNRMLEDGRTWFYSRSRQKLWNKGETSGNYQNLVSIDVDCDGDALLLRVIPEGPACHTGAVSCFFTNIFEREGG